jgi:AraC-like DNA-binding protein
MFTSSTTNSYDNTENLALRQGVQIQASLPKPTGAAARDPSVLLNETAYRLNGQPLSVFLINRAKTFDTYDGHNQAHGCDWYELCFPEPVMLNCIDMTMECPNRDGGWWTSLNVEIKKDNDDIWQAVQNLNIVPPYNFEDTPIGRKPYETHALTFERVQAKSVRIIGRPGGLAQFTSLARLAVYHRDLSRWNPGCLPTPPVPYIFRLIAPATIWDLSESLVKLTGLAISLPYMDHYLDAQRYKQWWSRISRNYQGYPELWHLVGDSIGWDEWRRIENNPEITGYMTTEKEPYIRIGFHNTIARAVAPIVIDDEVLGEMSSHVVIIDGNFDPQWHQEYAARHQISWNEYSAAAQRSPHMAIEQLEGAATLMGMIANTIARLAHKNLALQSEIEGLRTINSRDQQRRALVEQAINFMQEYLEEAITVADVAEAVALSPTYFGIIFAEHIGCTPIEFLIDLRLKRAKEYLAYTDMSVMDVCVALGYNPSYFSRLFKRHAGCTPGQYARNARAM